MALEEENNQFGGRLSLVYVSSYSLGVISLEGLGGRWRSMASGYLSLLVFAISSHLLGKKKECN